jgi:hypothetical protein
MLPAFLLCIVAICNAAADTAACCTQLLQCTADDLILLLLLLMLTSMRSCSHSSIGGRPKACMTALSASSAAPKAYHDSDQIDV